MNNVKLQDRSNFLPSSPNGIPSALPLGQSRGIPRKWHPLCPASGAIPRDSSQMASPLPCLRGNSEGFLANDIPSALPPGQFQPTCRKRHPLCPASGAIPADLLQMTSLAPKIGLHIFFNGVVEVRFDAHIFAGLVEDRNDILVDARAMMDVGAFHNLRFHQR